MRKASPFSIFPLVRRGVLSEVEDDPDAGQRMGRPRSKAWTTGGRAERALVEEGWKMVDNGNGESER
jgi:hypothetical protein